MPRKLMNMQKIFVRGKVHYESNQMKEVLHAYLYFNFQSRLAKDNDNFHVNVNSSAFKVRGVLFEYARQNLATINVYIQQPVVTKIVKDERYNFSVVNRPSVI